MHRDSRKMLRFIRKSDLLSDGSCLLVDFYEAYAAYVKWPEQRVMATLRELEEEGYISYCDDNHGNRVGFELEHKGYHPRYYAWVRIRDFLLESVVVPIVVAAVTAYITLLLESLGITNLLPGL